MTILETGKHHQSQSGVMTRDPRIWVTLKQEHVEATSLINHRFCHANDSIPSHDTAWFKMEFPTWNIQNFRTRSQRQPGWIFRAGSFQPVVFFWCSIGYFQKSWYPQIILFNRVFHYKSSIWGTPIFGFSCGSLTCNWIFQVSWHTLI